MKATQPNLQTMSVGTLLANRARLETLMRTGRGNAATQAQYAAYQLEVAQRCEPPKIPKRSRIYKRPFRFAF